MAGAQRQASQTSSPQHLQCDLQGPPAATTRAAAPSAVSGDCAGHCGESRAPSGDNARRSPFCAGHCGGSRAPSGDNARRSPFCSLWKLRRPLRREPGPQQPLLQSRETAPATAERAGPPAATTRAAALLQSLETAPATAERAGPSAATTRAAAPSAVSGDCAGHCGCEV